MVFVVASSDMLKTENPPSIFLAAFDRVRVRVAGEDDRDEVRAGDSGTKENGGGDAGRCDRGERLRSCGSMRFTTGGEDMYDDGIGDSLDICCSM